MKAPTGGNRQAWEVGPCALVPLGWRRGKSGPTTRRPVEEFVHVDRYGNRAFPGPSGPFS